MRRDMLELDATFTTAVEGAPLSLGDVEAIRLLLTGGSVVDWHKAAFTDAADVDRLLHLHLFDLDDALDEQRARWLFREAVTYVEEYLQLRVPAKIRDVADIRQVFLWASDTRGFRRTQVLSCMILKLMHVMQHLEAAELRTRVSVSERVLHDFAHLRMAATANRMRDDGLPLVAFYGSRKTRASVIAKLLSKRDDVAARVFDKLRYRVVMETPDDLGPALAWLVHHGFPFNLVMPGQSHNNLLDPQSLEDALDLDTRAALQALPPEALASGAARNGFSGAGYRIINFIIDLPVRLSPDAQPPGTEVSLGRVVYITTEFQIVDARTDARNEEGDSAHALYKRRQADKVRSRLARGQYQKRDRPES